MDKLKSKLKDAFIFKNLSDTVINEALSGVEIELNSYERGDIIYSPNQSRKAVGFVLSGACEVKRMHADGTAVPLNTITPIGSFGIISVLSENEDFPTYIVSKSKSEVAFIDKVDFLSLMRSSADISINVAEFLAGRVTFLNDKVTAFSASTCEEKLVVSILSSAKAKGGLEFPFNRKKTAESISCGRASLYRSLETLKDGGYIDYDNKKIYIKDLDGLERIVK